MKGIGNIFEYYLKNRINNDKEKELKITLAALIALANYLKDKDFDLSKVIEMIMLENTNITKLINQEKIKVILDEFYSNSNYESMMAQKCLKNAENMFKNENMIEKIDHIYGRLLLAIGIDIECGLKLDFNELYQQILSITKKDLETEIDTRKKYCHYTIYNVTKDYAHLISILEENIKIKVTEIENKDEFDKIYNEQKRFYRLMPILSGILEKTKKL